MIDGGNHVAGRRDFCPDHGAGDLAAAGFRIGWSAAFGAALALATGGVQLADIPVVWHIVWNATATFIAVIIISLLLDESGFLNGPRCTFPAGEEGGVVCYLRIILLGAAVAALFANDGAALILTPS